MWRRILCVCFFCLALLNIVLIFSFSGEKGTDSGSRSYRVTDKVLRILDPTRESNTSPKGDKVLVFFNPIVRNAAHFAEYASLGVFCCLGFLCTGVRRRLKPFFALLICLMTAMADEIYQSTVPGRSAQIADVFLDTAGSLTGILLTMLITLAMMYLIRSPRGRTRKPKKQSSYKAAPGGRFPPI